MKDMQELIVKVTAYVQHHMGNYDGSHDISHIHRVLGLSHHIHSRMAMGDGPQLDLDVITLSALMHDVGDRKYLIVDQDGTTMIRDALLKMGATQELAEKIQIISSAVSYSSEIKDPDYVAKLIVQYPELACVQDADRLDSIGAVGLGRLFTYGGAKGGRAMVRSLELMDSRLLKLAHVMKTAPGKQMARERTERMTTFLDWWARETVVQAQGAAILSVDPSTDVDAVPDNAEIRGTHAV